MSSEHQQRVQEQLDQGYSLAEAQGRARAQQAGYEPLPFPSVDKPDKPGTTGPNKPGHKPA